jgi:hypothetical protein
MGKARAHDTIKLLRWAIEPIDQPLKLLIEPLSGRSFIIHTLALMGTRDDSHRLLTAKLSHADLIQSGASRREEGCLPSVQASKGETLTPVLCGVLKHVPAGAGRAPSSSSTPSRRALERRSASTSSISPSIALVPSPATTRISA